MRLRMMRWLTCDVLSAANSSIRIITKKRLPLYNRRTKTQIGQIIYELIAYDEAQVSESIWRHCYRRHYWTSRSMKEAVALLS